MDAETLKTSLSKNDILALLEEFQAEPKVENSVIISRTVCHNGVCNGSHKLYWYEDTGVFNCYTNCSSMDVFELVMKVKNVEFIEAFNFIKDFFQINGHSDITPDERIETRFFDKFNKKTEFKKLPSYNKKVLRVFDDKYHVSWVRDYISPDIMKKYNIKLDILRQRIIIPHYDIDDRLVGIRVRNLDEDMVERGMKYVPLFTSKTTNYRHMTGSNLYGLNITKDNIEAVKKVVLFEGEKSVLALDTFYGGKGIGVGVSGANLSEYQRHILNKLDIEEVVIAFDKEFHEIGDPLERFYADKIEKTIINKLKASYNISVIWDTKDLLDYKDSPTDKGKDVWLELWDNRIRIN